MKVKIYSNPKEAYEFMNSWTQIKSSYEIQFHGKNVNEVKIIMQRGKPRLSFVHYKTDFGGGIQTIDLSKNILLDKPKKNLANILTQKSR